MCNMSLFDRIIKHEVTEIQGIRVRTEKKTNDMTSVCVGHERRERVGEKDGKRDRVAERQEVVGASFA